MKFLRFVAERVISALVVIALIAVVLYAVFFMLPTDPAQLSCGKPCSPERLSEVRTFMGLDRPWYLQMWDYVTGIVAGRTFGDGSGAIVCSAPCFGYSFRLRESVVDLVASRFPVTASIAVGAAVLWLIIGVGLGVVSAIKRGSWLDRAILGLSVVGVSAPAYLVGLLAVALFALKFPLFPPGGYVAFRDNPVEWASHLILPWVVLAVLHAAAYTRITRTQMVTALGEDYIRTARSKGLSERRVVDHHALRNVLLPITTIFGLDLGGLLGGAVLTEKVFSMQGLGSLLLDAVGNLDLQVLVGVTLLSAILIILANLVVDILYGVLDPRVSAS